MKSLILVGGGHAHLSVLRALATHRNNFNVTLITPNIFQTYSGMLPGWIAGRYSLPHCQIDLRPLAEVAGVRLIVDQVVGMNADLRCVRLGNGMDIEYDYVSLDVGSESNLSTLGVLGDRLLPVRPITTFVERWSAILGHCATAANYHLAVVGGGAAGVEIALTAQYALARQSPDSRVTLIASAGGLLPGHAAGVVRRVEALLEKRNIALRRAQAAGHNHGILLDTGERMNADIVIAATGSRPPPWLGTSHLALDQPGYVSVDAMHRSISHHNVFAAGDVCSRSDTVMSRSGVHAVFAGPVLADNLIAGMSGGRLASYRPRKRSLYLLSTGPDHAIASWGPFSAAGKWVSRWKHWIDLRFMKKHGNYAYRHEQIA